MKIYLRLLFCLAFAGCGVKTPDLNTSVLCPSSENFVSHDLVFNMGAGEKIANRFNVNGITTGSINLRSVRLFMSTTNITSVTVKIYSGSSSSNPDTGTLLNTTTAAISTTSASVTTPVDVSLSSIVPIHVDQVGGESYFIVIEPTPGTYSISYTLRALISGSRIDMSNGVWSKGSEFSDNLSMIFSYSGCST